METAENLGASGALTRPGLERPAAHEFTREPRISAKIALYTEQSVAPQLEAIAAEFADEFLGALTSRVFQLSSEAGGRVPLTAIKEIVDNTIHADFAGVSVSILSGGQIVRVADCGPGVADKERALSPGFGLGANKQAIRGVGAGFYVASSAMEKVGGSLIIEDNLSCGTVVTLEAPAAEAADNTATTKPATPDLQLTTRQKKTFFIVVEMGAIGPSAVAKELVVGLSTAHRDLRSLEKLGLIKRDRLGKRNLTALGRSSVDEVLDP